MKIGMNKLSHSSSEEILIVDEDPYFLEILYNILKDKSYRIIKAHNGKEAVELLTFRPLALVVCNHRMKDITGLEVLKKSYQSCSDASRILLIEAVDKAALIANMNLDEISYCITKPFDPNLLRGIVRESIEKFGLKKHNQNLESQLAFYEMKSKEIEGTHLDEFKKTLLFQRLFLKPNLPKNFNGLEILCSNSQNEELSGDFYEFYQPNNQILDLAIGDVLGKEPSALLLSTALKTMLKRFATPFFHSQIFNNFELWHENLLSPTEILNLLRTELSGKLIFLEQFVTIFYGRFDLSKHIFSYVDCGSTKLIQYNAASDKLIFLKGMSHTRSITENHDYLLHETPFGENDFFIFYSKNILEVKSPNQELFGERRLIETIEAHIKNRRENLVNVIKQALIQFTENKNIEEKIMLVVIKICHKQAPLIHSHFTGKFIGEYNQLKAVRQLVQESCQRGQGNTFKLANELQLAINEIFCNIVKHSYSGKRSQYIVVQIELLEDGVLFQISDKGEPFHPETIPPPDFTGEQENGYGWHIIKEIVDHIAYVPKNSETGWNYLRIFKRYIRQGDLMDIEHMTKNDILIITPDGESLDAKDAPLFKEKVLNIISTNGKSQVIFDLQNLNFIDSSGMGSLLSILRQLNNQGGELKLARVNRPLRTMFELVSMHKIFEIFNTTEEAIRSFK